MPGLIVQKLNGRKYSKVIKHRKIPPTLERFVNISKYMIVEEKKTTCATWMPENDETCYERDQDFGRLTTGFAILLTLKY